MTQYILHKLPEGFIITSNQQPVNGLYLDTYINKVKNTNGAEYEINEITKQVIAQQDQIDFSNLTEKEQGEIGWFDVERICVKDLEGLYGTISDIEHISETYVSGFKTGFYVAQELLSDKRFTTEDVFKLMELLRDTESRMIFEVKTRKFVSQPKSWNIEIETECSVCGLTGVHKMSCKTPSLRTQQLRLNNGKIKITKIL